MLTEGLGKDKSLVLVFQCCRIFAECADTPQNHRAQANGASWLAAELGAWGLGLGAGRCWQLKRLIVPALFHASMCFLGK